MTDFLNTPFTLKNLLLPNRLIQGPLAGYSCAPFRVLFSLFQAPAYCVTEMLSAYDVVTKHALNERYLFRDQQETLLCYQIAGNDPYIMAEAASKLEKLGANIIDINCGCPKDKIRKKGAGSALLAQPEQLIKLIAAIRQAITIPLTVKIRLQESNKPTIELAKKIADAGADALIIHGRQWNEDYDVPCNLSKIAQIKQIATIPVILNGDLKDRATTLHALDQTGCDAFMIARAGCGRPWLFQEILTNQAITLDNQQLSQLFIQHLTGLATLENDYKATLQSRSLLRYYFRNTYSRLPLATFYQLKTLAEIQLFLQANLPLLEAS